MTLEDAEAILILYGFTLDPETVSSDNYRYWDFDKKDTYNYVGINKEGQSYVVRLRGTLCTYTDLSDTSPEEFIKDIERFYDIR